MKDARGDSVLPPFPHEECERPAPGESMRNLLLATSCALFLGILTTACGGASPSSAPSSEPVPSTGPSQSSSQSPPNEGGTSGGPRLSWDQHAPSAQELGRYSFVLYVDGTPTVLTGATCGTLSATTLTAACTAPLPAMSAGQHTLELATRVTENGAVLESARSAPITHTAGATGVASGTAGATAAVPGAGAATDASDASDAPRSDDAQRSPSGDTASGTGQATDEDQLIVETVVTGLDRPSALARLPDGRLLIAEHGGTIRIAERGGALNPGPAAHLPDADPAEDARVSLALAPDFEASRHVYVGYGAVDARGARAGRVVRFREAGGVLGEAAVILDGLPAALAAPWVAIGPDGQLYVGTSSADDGEAADIGSYAGKILRFRLDGSTPSDNPLPSSPVFSFGYRGVAGIDWDGQTGRLWALVTDNEGAELALAGAGGPGTRIAGLGPIGPARMAFAAARAAAVPVSWRGSLFVAAPDEQCLLRVSGLSDSAAAPSVQRLLRGEFGRIVLVLPAEDGLYFATGNGVAAAGHQTIDAVYRVRVTRSPR